MMRLLQHTELNTVAGAGFTDFAASAVTKLQQELARRGITAVVDPYGNTVTVNTPVGSRTVKLPPQTLALLQAHTVLL
jgi:hypothetical protein